MDWPAASFWREIAAAFPDALVLLSVRRDASTWWRSFEENIFPMVRQQPAPERGSWHVMAVRLLEREIGKDWYDEASAVAAYNRHIDTVRSAIPPQRLIWWQPEDGWPPLCHALGCPVPDEPFPCLNTTAQRRQWRSLESPEQLFSVPTAHQFARHVATAWRVGLRRSSSRPTSHRGSAVSCSLPG